MKDNKIRGLLAIVIIVFVLGTCSYLVLNEYYYNFRGVGDPEAKFKALKEYSALFSGIVGMIIGYYFRGSDKWQ